MPSRARMKGSTETMPTETAILSPPSVCVMLAGGIRSCPLERALGVSVLDLPIDGSRTLAEGWLESVGGLNRPGLEPPRMVITLGSGTSESVGVREGAGISLEVKRDRDEYRGPAGAVKDAAGDVDACDDVLICEAGMWGPLDLRSLLWAHRDLEADVTVCRNPDGSPSGVYLARGWTLGLIQSRGFIDLKEQWFTKARGNGASIRVFDCGVPGMRSVRTRESYLEVCRLGIAEESESVGDIFVSGSGASSRWSVVGEGARVDPSALVSESVLMPGAEVEADSVVVRSVVGPGVRVRRGQQLIDAVAGRAGVTHG